MAPRRVYNNNSYSSNGRVITVGGGAGGGGLNERFSQLDKAKKQNPPSEARGSVFARIRGAGSSSSNSSRRSDIQNRLSKPAKSGAIRKRGGGGGGPTPMKGVERTHPAAGKQARGGAAAGKRGGGARGASKSGKNVQRGGGNTGGKRGGRGGKRGGKRAPVSASDLDKSLDDYMMKDPKTAQSRLDAELSEYMDDSGDVLMDL